MKRVSADEARTMFEQTLKLEKDFHQHFTGETKSSIHSLDQSSM